MQWCACKVWKVSLRELRRKLRAKGRRPSHGKMLVCYPPPNGNAKNNPKRKMLRETSNEGRSPWKLMSLALASHWKLRDLHTIRCSRLSGSGKKSNVLVVKSSMKFRGKRACAEASDDCFCVAILVAVPRHFVAHVSFWCHAKKKSHVRKKICWFSSCSWLKWCQQGWHDVLHFSALPTLRLPIIYVWKLVHLWFANLKPPSVDSMASIFGLSGQVGSPVHRLATMLRSAEAQCAVKMQNSRKLAGLVEVDGTSLRSWRLPRTQMLAYYQLFGAIQRGSRMVNIYSIGVSHARNMGKPPPESFARIFRTAFPKDLDRKDNEGRTSCLISDGAPCYPKLKRELKVLHRSVSHAKGEFVKKDKIHGCQVSIHTGEIDNVWNAINSAIPNSLTTKSKGEVNPLLLHYARQWQWRWSNSRSSNLALATARYFWDLWMLRNVEKKVWIGECIYWHSIKSRFRKTFDWKNTRKRKKPCWRRLPREAFKTTSYNTNLCNLHIKISFNLVPIVNDNISDTKTIHGTRKTL